MLHILTRTTVSRTAAHLAGAALFVAGLFAGVDSPRPAAADGGEFHSGPNTCRSGYVWRDAFDGDGVCVTPQVRDQAAADNAAAASRHLPGSNRCQSGYVWRDARDGDDVCVTPQTREQVKADNARTHERYQASAPGTHTLTLEPSQVLSRRSDKYYTDTCTRGGTSPIFDPTVLEAGWLQVEADGDPCLAAVNQVAVRFDTSAMDRIRLPKTVTRAVLTYDEQPSGGCPAGAPVTPPAMPVPDCSRRTTTWTSGSGAPEHKPNGCVVVRIPSVEWMTTAPNGLLPYVTHPSGRPTVTRLGAQSWDVTEPFRFQTDPSAMPLQAPGAPPLQKGYGFLLSSGPSLDQLEAEDNTSCMSLLSNIRLQVTYTVYPDAPFREPR